MKRNKRPVIQLFTAINESAASGKNGERNLKAVSYGPDREQVMDLYLPVGYGQGTKTFILLHGGGWSGGSRSGVDYIVPVLQAQFPDYAVVNMDYRLASFDRPAFPMQVQDIERVLQFIGAAYGLNGPCAFIGVSAGAHLALLYGYRHDAPHRVKAICSIVGPADFTDPFYAHHPYYQYAAMYLLGNAKKDHAAISGISPAQHAGPQSPPTILFYGGKDPLVPISQAQRLKAKLDKHGVTNEYHAFPNGGHGGWSIADMNHLRENLLRFMQQHF